MRWFETRSLLLAIACSLGCHVDGTDEPPTRAKFGGPVSDFPRGEVGQEGPVQGADAPPVDDVPSSSSDPGSDDEYALPDDKPDGDAVDAGSLLDAGPASDAAEEDASAGANTQGDADIAEASVAADAARDASNVDASVAPSQDVCTQPPR